MSGWNVRFSGSAKDPPIRDVVFRVERLARACGIDRDYLVDGLHNVLTGDASSWFWHFLRKNQDPTWRQLRDALVKRFAPWETDAEIRTKMAMRTQRRGEKFSDFVRGVEELSFQLHQPIEGARLMRLLMKNADTQMMNVLCMHDIRSVEHMLDVSQQYEELWASKNRMQRPVRRSEDGADDRRTLCT